MRSKAVQTRSRERVDLLLTTAEALLLEGGMDGLKMRELARRAGLPIASVYHYFPSNGSVIRALAERHLEALRVVIAREMRAVMAQQIEISARPATARILTANFVAHLIKTPASAHIWDGLRFRPDLRQLDLEDTGVNARFLETYMRWVVPALPDDMVADQTLLLVEAIQANILIVLHSPLEKQETLTTALGEMATATLRGLQLR
jgi:AcrR family transcriptional regulator